MNAEAVTAAKADGDGAELDEELLHDVRARHAARSQVRGMAVGPCEHLKVPSDYRVSVATYTPSDFSPLGAYRQKPSIQILPDPQSSPVVGSHSSPRFVLEPQTS